MAHYVGTCLASCPSRLATADRRAATDEVQVRWTGVDPIADRIFEIGSRYVHGSES